MTLMIRIAAALLAAPLAPAAAQQSIEAPGTVAHAAAATGFPERVGEFRRTSVTRFDEAGRNIAAGYALARGDRRLVLTIYIYPAARLASAPGSGQAADIARAQLCRAEFDGVQQVISRQYRDVSLIENGPAPAIAGVEPQLSHKSVHRLEARFGADVQQVRSETYLYCFVGGDWLVKYRATSHLDLDATSAVETFIRSGPWPGRQVQDAPMVAETAPAANPLSLASR